MATPGNHILLGSLKGKMISLAAFFPFCYKALSNLKFYSDWLLLKSVLFREKHDHIQGSLHSLGKFVKKKKKMPITYINLPDDTRWLAWFILYPASDLVPAISLMDY